MQTEVQVSRKPLRYARTELGLTQTQLSERAGVNIITIVRAEKGDTILLLSAQAILGALNALRAERKLAPLALSDLSWTIQGE